MQGEIDKNIDLIGANHARYGLIGNSEDFAPVIGDGAQFIGHCVGPGDVGVAENFERRPVMRFEQRHDVLTDDVPSEIRRNVADAQAASG